MNKKLMAVAVAGALAVPGIAFAQTTVTISGFFKVSVDQISATGATAGPAGGALVAGGVGGGRYGNTTESRVVDNSSRLIFNVREDLGNGLAAVGQLDIRFNPPGNQNQATTQLGAVTANGNTWVGLSSAKFGTLTFGKNDLHYGKAGDNIATGALQSAAISLFDYVAKPVAASVAGNTPASSTWASIANTTRTPNVVKWASPVWNGFDLGVAWSSNPLSGVNGELGTTTLAASGVAGAGPNAGQTITRRGQGWNINPRYTASNWGVEYSYWNAKADPASGLVTGCITISTLAGCAMPDDQRSDVVAGWFEMSGWRVGLAWNRAKTTSVSTGYTTADRDAWAFPVAYTTGPHRFGYTYVRANASKDVTSAAGANVSGSNTGANMNNLYYEYNLSKRSAVGFTWSQIQNQSAGTYSNFTQGATSLGSANQGALAGEKIRLFSLTMLHRF